MRDEFAIVYSDFDDVYRNLALEELLLTGIAKEMPLVMFCRNNSAVVIGKHQNPWLECNFEAMENVALARRISGGGAVYHDKGNLNYSFMYPKECYCREDAHSVLIEALAAFGLRASVRGESNIVVRDRKISGSAFCHKREAVLHHGTLLIDADTKMLGAVLNSPAIGIETHATKSVPAKVVNLKELKPGIDSRQISESIVSSFAAKYEVSPHIFDASELVDGPSLDMLRADRDSSDWVYGNTPKFSLPWRFKTRSAEQSLQLTVEKGHVSEVLTADGERVGESTRESLLGKSLRALIK